MLFEYSYTADKFTSTTVRECVFDLIEVGREGCEKGRDLVVMIRAVGDE